MKIKLILVKIEFARTMRDVCTQVPRNILKLLEKKKKKKEKKRIQ
jgi:hypothetical protein